MHIRHQTLTLSALVAVSLLSAGCGNLPGAKPADSTPSASAAPAPKGTPPGMNDRGEVIDSSKVQAGNGTLVKGINDFDGEITGKPAGNSKFGQLKIGMPMKQVTDMIGAPTDQGAYLTGKAFIPFYFGADRSRYELVYKGQGRLIMAGQGGFSFGGGNLVWIIHNPNEPGYR